ncbi:MAG: stage II sporulation protein M [Desulfurococcales archaeon]|nr:stage II sporulation protein M [Desulfurococcales archaeon]
MERVFFEVVSNDKLAKWVLVGILLFSFSILVYPSLPPFWFIEQIKENMKENISSGEGFFGVMTMLPLIIAINNIVASFFTLAGGFIVVGYPTVMIFNGLIVGSVALDAVSQNPLVPIYTSLAVHGILEIPIIALAGSLGLARILKFAKASIEETVGFVAFSIIVLAFIESSLTIVFMALDAVWRSLLFGVPLP